MTRPGTTEREFQAAVIDLAAYYGWKVWHEHDSRRNRPGWPDLALLRAVPGDARLLLRELKADHGRLSVEQRVVLDELTAAGVDVAVWRPGDLASGLIAQELRRRPTTTVAGPDVTANETTGSVAAAT